MRTPDDRAKLKESGRYPDREEKAMEILNFITSVVSLLTAVILWQTAKRNRRDG